MKLDELRSAIESKYQPVPVELSNDTTIYLRTPLRLKDAERECVMKYMEGLQGLEEAKDIPEAEVISRSKFYISEILKVAAGTKGDDLLEELDDDYLLTMEVFAEWSRATQAPEADSSSEQSNDRMGQLSLISDDSTASTSLTSSTETSLPSTP